jgi:hypothetical protein
VTKTLRFALVAFALLLAGCAAPSPMVGAGPAARAADPAAAVAPLAPRPLATTDFAPVGAGNWTERNQAVTPAP